MLPPLLKRSRIRLYLLSSVLLSIVLNSCFHRTQYLIHHTPRQESREVCRLSSVHALVSPCVALPGRALVAASDAPCQWNVRITSHRHPATHQLVVPPASQLQPAELRFLVGREGCNSPAECNSTVPCTYGSEDPSDALWLRMYSNYSKFVVLFNIGIASLAFFIAAIIADGTIFQPHRSGFALTSASALILLAVAAFVYAVVLPARWQFSLYGAGTYQTIGYLFMVTFIAVLLPACFVTWFTSIGFLVFFIGFFFEHIFNMFAATLHFLAVLFVYQTGNLFLHLRLVYFQDVSEEDFDQRVLELSETFMQRTRCNWFMDHVPRVMEDSVLQVIGNNLPERILDSLALQDRIAQADFDALEEAADLPSTEGAASSSSENPTDSTPLLQRSSTT